MSVSVIILQYGKSYLTEQCIQSLLKYKLDDCVRKIYLIDNNSPSVTDRELLLKLKNLDERIKIIFNDQNFGFGLAHNKISSLITEKYMLLINNDTFVIDDSINKFVNRVFDADVDVSTGVLLNDDLTLQANTTGFYFFPCPIKKISFFLKNRLNKNITYEVYCNGALLMMKTKIFKQLNGFDEKLFMYSEDLDLMIRINKAGYSVVKYSDIRLVHLGGVSSDQLWENEEKVRLQIHQGNSVLKKHHQLVTVYLFSVLYMMTKIPQIIYKLLKSQYKSIRFEVKKIYWKIVL